MRFKNIYIPFDMDKSVYNNLFSINYRIFKLRVACRGREGVTKFSKDAFGANITNFEG